MLDKKKYSTLLLKIRHFLPKNPHSKPIVPTIVAPASQYIIENLTSGLAPDNKFKLHLLDSIPYFRYLIMGAILLIIMRFRPKGILPEKIRYS